MNKPWFGPRKFGYGFTPVSSEGWICTFLIVVGVIALIMMFF